MFQERVIADHGILEVVQVLSFCTRKDKKMRKTMQRFF